MMNLRTAFGTALIATTLALPAAAAADALDLRYSLSLRGLPAGQMVLRHEESGESYRSELSARARGLANLLSGYQSTAISQGRVSPEDGLEPLSYHWVSDRRNKLWVTDIVFDHESGEVARLDISRNRDPRGTQVPPELQRDVLDPVAAIVDLRRQTAEALAGGPQRYDVSVFDGRRRYDIEAELVGRTIVTIDRRAQRVVEVRLVFRPLAGLDDDDLARLPGEGGYALAHLSDDERLVPLRIETHGAPIATVARLVAGCVGTECALTN